MEYQFNIPNRLNWIDWAKVIAISCVVFGHIPQVSGSFPQHYIVTFHMPMFFFISGYLTKREYFNTVTLKKYWHTLIIPYILYNIIFYPYWMIKHLVESSDVVFYDYIKPFIGILTLQIPTSVSEPLNQVTWFIAALLVMKIILAICNHSKKKNLFIIFLIVAFTILYIVNKQYIFSHSITTDGFLKCFPFYLIGHLCKQNKLINEVPKQYDWFICLLGISISVFIYFYCGRHSSNILISGLRFWSICVLSILGVLSLCKLFDNVVSTIIRNLSIGTIVIMGLHWMMIGTTNAVISKLIHIEGKIIYPFIIAIILMITYEALLYPIIILFKNKFSFMLGKSKNNSQCTNSLIR